jgi:hypothetical protein
MLYATDVGISLVSAAANPGVYIFSANGLFDPDITGTGHQPRGFDQLMLFYDHYVVQKTKITVRFFNASTATPAVAFITVRDSSVKSTNALDYVESSITKSTSLAVEGSSSANKTLEHLVDVGRFLGRNDTMSDSQLKGDAANNPVEGCFFHVGAYTPDLFTATTVQIQVVIEYHLTLIEPKIVAAS